MRIIGCMATYDKRKSTRLQSVNSIAPQLDDFFLIDNSAPNITNRFDNSKFSILEMETKEPFYMLLLDDDLIYPSDYALKMVKDINKYQCIITHHGRKLNGVGLNYYFHNQSFHCMRNIYDAEIIDVAGTGVTGFNTEYFHPKGLTYSKDVRMSDLIFSLEAAKQGKTIGVVPHRSGWIRHINNKETIFETESKGCRRQNQIADEIYKLNNND